MQSDCRPAEQILHPLQRAKSFLVFGACLHLVFGTLAFRHAEWPLAVLLASCFITTTAAYIALARGHTRTASTLPALFCQTILMFYVVAYAGHEHGRALWFFSLPVMASILLPPKEGALWTGASLVGAVAIMLYGNTFLGTSAYSAGFTLRFVVTIALIGVSMFWSELALQRYREETEARKALIEAESARLKAEIVRRASLERDLRILATTDALTGLANRRAFMDRFSLELARAQRPGPNSTLLILDIDHFKAINDRYGHPAGDAVLSRLSLLLGTSLRNVDLIGRIGGEEFAVLLVETSAQMAQPVIDRLIEHIRETPVTLPDGTSLSFTASIGSTEILWGDTIDTAIQRADEALYSAKKGGRDRHCQR